MKRTGTSSAVIHSRSSSSSSSHGRFAVPYDARLTIVEQRDSGIGVHSVHQDRCSEAHLDGRLHAAQSHALRAPHFFPEGS